MTINFLLDAMDNWQDCKDEVCCVLLTNNLNDPIHHNVIKNKDKLFPNIKFCYIACVDEIETSFITTIGNLRQNYRKIK